MNSRHQKRTNSVWRRRKCLSCGAVFTTLEAVDASQALSVRNQRRYEPFYRDTLLLSVYESLRHRKTAITDATALTGTILGRLYPHVQEAVIDRDEIVKATQETLNRFDKAAATSYAAFHPL